MDRIHGRNAVRRPQLALAPEERSPGSRSSQQMAEAHQPGSRSSRARIAISALLAVLVGIAAMYVIPKPLPELSRAEFLAEVRSGHVQRVTIDGDVIVAASSARGEFRTSLKPDESGVLAELRSRGVEIEYAEPGLSI